MLLTVDDVPHGIHHKEVHLGGVGEGEGDGGLLREGVGVVLLKHELVAVDGGDILDVVDHVDDGGLVVDDVVVARDLPNVARTNIVAGGRLGNAAAQHEMDHLAWVDTTIDIGDVGVAAIDDGTHSELLITQE